MKSKKAKNPVETLTKEVPPTPIDDPATEITTKCGAWAFLLGPSLGAFCRLDAGHEGDHRTDINVLSEPRSHFTVLWALDD